MDGKTHYGPCWSNEDGLKNWQGGLGHVIPDEYLKPIRDPGDDATDESKAWLPPVPTTTKELA
jgi:hypothetical protein